MTEAIHGQDHRNIGALIGRPDLDEAVLCAALERRLMNSSDKRTASDIVLALKNGDAAALSLFRTIVVPPPVSKLTMPMQRLSTGRRAALQAAVSRLISGSR